MNNPIFVEGLLKDHVAFVTGGGTGITGGVARALAEAGAAVALVSRQLDHLEPAAAAINEQGGRAFAVPADVRKPEEVANAIAATVAHFGKIDIVVNGAAIDIVLSGTFNISSCSCAGLEVD